MTTVGRLGVGVLVAVLAGCALVWRAEARGYWAGGVSIGVVPPVFISPYPRPYYGPGPYGGYSRPAASEGCYAGPYVCPLEAPSVVGMPCSCPTMQGSAWGRAR